MRERFERLDESFEIHDGIDIPAGDYTFRELGLRVFLSDSRLIGGRASVSAGDFFDGTRRRAGAEATWKPSERLSLEAEYEINRVDLPTGDFTTHRTSQRMLLTLSTDLYVRGLVQWNSQREVVGGNLLLGYRYLPGSDLFLVYNHLWDTENGTHQLDRSLQLKLSYFWRP
jgi:hypothetical protein